MLSNSRIKVICQSDFSPPNRGIPTPQATAIKARLRINAVIKIVTRFARYTARLVCPTISLLRRVPSAYSVPRYRPLTTGSKNPTSIGYPKKKPSRMALRPIRK